MTERARFGLTSLAISRPVGTLALASVVMVMGLYFLQRLPIDLLPSIDYPQIRISVEYPGVSAEVIEEQVTRVLERSLAATENLTKISSEVEDSQTDIDLTFEFGTDLDLALQDTARGLEQARPLLPDIDPPRVRKFDPGQQAVWQGGFSSTVRSEAALNDWIENTLSPQLIGIPGVSSVEAAGGMVREIEVIVDQQRLLSYGMGMDDVSRTLAAENRDLPIGRVTSETFDVAAKTEGLFTSLEQIENVLLPLPREVSRYGQNIRLADIADVIDGNRRQRVFARLDGTPASQVSIYKLPEANTVAVADAVRATLTRLERDDFIPADISYRPTQDPTYFIRGALSSVSSAALLGGTLAMIMVLLFLGSLRKGFVIGISIPIAIMATFSLMGFSGLTLNIISMGGLALGVGLLLGGRGALPAGQRHRRTGIPRNDSDDLLRDSRHPGRRPYARTLTGGFGRPHQLQQRVGEQRARASFQWWHSASTQRLFTRTAGCFALALGRDGSGYSAAGRLCLAVYSVG